MAKEIIDTLVEVVIFTALIGTIAVSVAGSNISGTASILLGLTTLFVVIGFIRGLVGNMKSKK